MEAASTGSRYERVGVGACRRALQAPHFWFIPHPVLPPSNRGGGSERTIQPLQHRHGVLQHLVIPEADDGYPFTFEERRPCRIAVLRSRGGVLPTVQLDAQPLLVAVEVQDIGLDRVLAAELQPAESIIPQQPPEQAFGVGLFSAELASKRNECRRERRYALTPPSTVLSGSTPPLSESAPSPFGSAPSPSGRGSG